MGTHYVTGDEIISAPSAPSRSSCASASRSSRRRANCSRRSACGCAPSTTSRCWPRRVCGSGVESYSRHLDGRAPGETPCTLAGLLPEGLPVRHRREPRAVPQLHGQYAGDRSRKDVLVEHGFRLPSAEDNRPLRFDEFVERVPQCVFVSATPGSFELEHRPGRRAGHPADRAGRPRGHDHAHQGPGRRPARPHRPTVEGRAGPGHHADQEDGRGPDRLPGRRRGPGPVPALGHRHHHPDRDPARSAARHASTCSSASTSCARASTCPRCRWLPSSTPTRRASCARPPRSSRPWPRRPQRRRQVVLYADTVTDSMREAVSVDPAPPRRQIAYNREHGIDPQTIRKLVIDILERLRGAAVACRGRPQPGGRPQNAACGEPPARTSAEGDSVDPGRRWH